jgi:hypothetical protein
LRFKGDFVTNSSTTSFVVWGVSFDDKSEIFKNEKILELAFDRYNRKYNEEGLTFSEFKEKIKEDSSVYEVMDLIDDNKLHPLSFSTGPEGYEFWIGGSPQGMRDDQTLGEYKKEIIEKLNELGFEVERLDFICEAWRDG